MRVYLVRHGEAAASHGSAKRSLTQRGRKETEKVAEFVGRIGVRVQSICHSGKLRAQQTAEILAERVDSAQGVMMAEGLMPDDDPKSLGRELGSATEDIMLVGHLPFMSRLASTLLTGDEAVEFFRFQPSSVLCLERTAEDGWQVVYFFPGFLDYTLPS